MAHIFDRSGKDPYVEAAHAVEQHAYSSEYGYQAGAGEQIYGTMADVIVDALGDIAAAAYRHGINQENQLKGLADAVAAVSRTVILNYRGEVNADPVFEALRSDPRLQSLAPPAQERLLREMEKTRQLDELKQSAMPLSSLLDMAGTMGLPMEEDLLEQGKVLLPGQPEETATLSAESPD